MGTLLHTRKAVLLLSYVFLWVVEVSRSEMSDLEADVGSANDLNKDYFFYQQSEYPRDCHEVLQRCSSLNSSGVYVIKPDGYPEPFDVYCDNDVSSSGWTVVHRRTDSFTEFDRIWEDFKDGFGFLSNEFWLGNEKLSYLTNQGVYELRVDLQLADGSSFYVIYSGFRISDEWGEYKIVNLGEYHSYGEGVITSCPRNMVYGNCTCRRTCEEPNGSSDCSGDCEVGTEGCFCPAGFLMDGDDCVPQSDCPCFWPDVNRIIPNGQSLVNDDCTLRKSCTNNQLTQEEYRCGSNAGCAVQNDVRQCYCNDGFRGDGQNCEPIYGDCYDAYNAGHRQDGVYLIKPTNWPGSAFNVFCVMSTNGGGWTVFQRRTDTDPQTIFYRNWSSYRDGFGSFGGNFWLGNEKLHYLTNQKSYKLRVDMRTSSNTPKYSEYSTFRIGNEGDEYRLTASGHSGTHSGGPLVNNNGKPFSTYDRDNDGCGLHHCAEKHKGGWWYTNRWCSSTWGDHCIRFTYGSTNALCTVTNLNGEFNGTNGQNIFWYYTDLTFCNLNFAEMKIRPSS